MKHASRVALAIGFLLFVPGLDEQFEAPKAMAIWILGAGLLGTALAAGPALWRSRWHPLDSAVIAWLAVEFLATASSIFPRLSLLGEPAQRDSLLTSVALASIYMAARLTTKGSGDALGTLSVALAASAAASLYAIAQALGVDPLGWTRTSAFGALSIRPFATFGHPNLLGVVTSACLAAAVSMSLILSGRRRLLCVAAALPLAAATTLTLSRAAWMGAVVGVLLACALARLSGSPAGLTRRALVIGGAVLLAGAGLVWMGGWETILSQRFQELLVPTGGTGRTRIEIWKAAISAWSASPWLGQGPGCFSVVFTRYQTPEYWSFEWGGLPLHAHSTYFDILATRGLLGAMAALACAVSAGLAARTAWRAGGDLRRVVAVAAGIFGGLSVAGGMGALGIGGSVLLVTSAAILASLAVGTAPDTGTAGGTIPEAVSGGRRTVAPLLTAGALAIATLLLLFDDLAASRSSRRGQEFVASAATLSGDAKRLVLESAVQEYASAASRAPRDDAIARRHAAALLYLSASAGEPVSVLDRAEAEAKRATILAPLRAINHRCLGAILMARARLGDAARVAEAESAYARALDLAPQDGSIMTELARAQVDLRRTEAALATARRAAAIYPTDGEAHHQIGRALIALGDREGARKALERADAAVWRGEESGRSDTRRLLDALRAVPTGR